MTPHPVYRRSPRIGSLFSGYGGLDMGVMAALGGEVVWYADVCRFTKDGHAAGHHEPHRAPCAIMAHHHPGVPNHGDVTAVDWPAVERIDILTGGSPCTDLSHAGKRAGMTEGTRSNLWVAMREAIAVLRPSLVVWENVRGAYSAPADSSVVLGGRLLGPSGGRPALRALGRVLGDLSDLGYDAWWHGLRAADVGAPHGRFRVFVVAYPQGDPWRLLDGDRRAAADAGRLRGVTRRVPAPTEAAPSGALTVPGVRRGVGTPTAAVALLPTPAVNDMGAAYTPEEWDAWTERMRTEHRNGHGRSLEIEAQRLLPTPGAIDGNGGPKRIREDGRTEADHGPALRDLASANRWGDYADAIHRWERLTRPAPDPTQRSKKGTPQLSPAFSEWMMGLPEGHVTAVPGLSRNDQLKALGNGVVPQQAEAEVRMWAATWSEVAA